MDKETLTFLLRFGHISMSERIERGLWPHPPLKFSEVVKHLADVIQHERWFPCEWQAATSGEPIREGDIIERKARFIYIYRAQGHRPDNPYVLAGQSQKVFYSARRAARHYLKWNLGLPGDLDGWKVVSG